MSRTPFYEQFSLIQHDHLIELLPVMAGGISALFGSDTGVREVAGLFLAALIGGYFGLDARYVFLHLLYSSSVLA